MKSHVEPIIIDGPEHPHAFTGIPIDRRPDHATQMCGTCKGHGAWNVLLHIDTGRCIIQGCEDCDGCGWVSDPEKRMIDDIVYDENGMPRWVLRLAPRPIRSKEPEEAQA